MKKLCLLLLAVLMILSMSACGTPKEENTESGTAPTETTPEKIDINVAVLSGPTGMGAASLMDKAAQMKRPITTTLPLPLRLTKLLPLSSMANLRLLVCRPT